MSILKQLISEMVENYLEESTEDGLIESIFEEVSEETWEAIEEAILNELSEDTYEMYMEGSIKGSGQDRKALLKRSFRAGQHLKYNDHVNRGHHSQPIKRKVFSGKRTKPDAFTNNSIDSGALVKGLNHPGFSNETDKKSSSGRRNADKLNRKSDSKVNSMVKRNSLKSIKPNLPS